VYLKDDTIVPSELDNLVVTSSDSSIIQILEIGQNANGFITTIKIKATGSGIADIAIAAPGYASTEFPVTVYGNKNNQAQLLIKTTPNAFSINGPDNGYVAVELADEDGLPTRAQDDIAITLTTSTSDVINLKNTELIINKGEYFVVAEFQANQPGESLIYASAPSMETVSSKVTVSEIGEPLTVKLYVFPSKISSFSANYAFAIVQLQDSNGTPVKANENIPVTIKVTSADQGQSVNTSGEFPGISINEIPTIKKGSYWAFSKIVTRGGLEGTYDVNIFAKDYDVSSPEQLEIVNLELLDDESAKLDLVPVLTTGNNELIGIMHLEDENVNPVASNKDLLIKVDSTDERLFSVQDVKIDKGAAAAPVFAYVGYAVPETLTLHLVTESDESIDPVITGPTTEGLTLVAEPLVSEVLSGADFPYAIYMSSDEEAAYFPEDLTLSIPPNEFVEVEPKVIKTGQSIILLNAKSVKAGLTTVTFEAGDFTANSDVDNLSSKPALLHLGYPEIMLTNIMNTFAVQILDAEENPIFADRDVEVRFVSNDQSIVSMPESVVIKKGDYYSTFEVEANTIGTTELSVLASDLPLSKYEISVDSIMPQLTINSLDYVNPNTMFDLSLTVQNLNSPLSGMNVEWNIEGAQIQSMDSVTDENGIARVSLLSQDPTKIIVQATVSGGMFSLSTVSKQINVNLPLDGGTGTSNMPMFGLTGLTPIFIIIPVAAAAVGIIFLKKKNMLNGLTEKISVIERINEVKERISHLRER
ncbi:MAG: hypothetical protein ACRD9Q_04515, partial [Nitrososphaeraceae archaeon]